MSYTGAEKAPGPASASAGTGPGQLHGRLAQWGVRLSLASGASIVSSIATFAIAYAVGGSSATEDNWVAYLVASMALAGLIGSLAAFALAIIAELKRERWPLLWLPLSLFPAALAFVMLGEAFWWE